MKQLTLLSAFSAGLLLLSSCKEEPKTEEPEAAAPVEASVSYPSRNPHLSAAIYGVTHVNSGQTNCVPYQIKDGDYQVNLNELTLCNGLTRQYGLI